MYTLTGARVTIKTGDDNKEFPSKVYVGLYVPEGYGYAMEQPSNNLKIEMKVNSTTEFGLMNAAGQNPDAKLLSNFQKNGFRLVIRYEPNFFMDAWKVEGVSLILEFKDQFGNPPLR